MPDLRSHHPDFLKSRSNTLDLSLQALMFVLCLFTCTCTDQTPKPYRVGILCGMEAFLQVAESFKATLKELDYREGDTISYDFRSANGDSEKEDQIARNFVADKVDLILAFPTESAVAAQKATQGTDIPVIFCNALIEFNDLVKSVRQPGGNITGVRFPGPELIIKRFEILLELVPDLMNLYIPYDPSYPNNPAALKVLRKLAMSRGIHLIEAPVNSVEELRTYLNTLSETDAVRVDAIQIMPEALTQSPDAWAAITKFASEHKIPIAGAAPFTVDQGAVFSLAPNLDDLGRQAAIMADKIFSGIPAGTIPIVTPEACLRLNYRVAQTLDLTVSYGLLKMATTILR